jgi:hypothetical protein
MLCTAFKHCTVFSRRTQGDIAAAWAVAETMKSAPGEGNAAHNETLPHATFFVDQAFLPV